MLKKSVFKQRKARLSFVFATGNCCIFINFLSCKYYTYFSNSIYTKGIYTINDFSIKVKSVHLAKETVLKWLSILPYKHLNALFNLITTLIMFTFKNMEPRRHDEIQPYFHHPHG